MTLTDFGVFLAPFTDAIRLIILPVFAWVAWKDIKTRRVPNRVWVPLLALGAALFAWDAWTVWGTFEWTFFVMPAAISLFIVIPAAYLMWLLGGFGGADAKAIMTLAIFYPTYPVYYAGSFAFPVVESHVGSFSFTILANAVAVALLFPVALAVWNVSQQNQSKVMFLGQPRDVTTVSTLPGRLLETPDGFTRSGLDLDALRMYLRWRGTTLDEIRADPSAYRDPVTVPEPEEANPPTDGAIVTDGGAPTSSADPVAAAAQDATDSRDPDSTSTADTPAETGTIETDTLAEETDLWGADQFLDDVEYAYGTTPEELRTGLEVLVQKDTVWVSPGTPFMVPIFVGLLTALLYGNLMFAVLQTLGLV